MSHTTTTLCYVRTTDGVVKVAAGERVPRGALPEQLQRLVDAGAVLHAPEDTEEEQRSAAPGTVDAILLEVGDDPTKARSFLEAELAKVKPRSKLVAKLEAIAGPPDLNQPVEGIVDVDGVPGA